MRAISTALLLLLAACTDAADRPADAGAAPASPLTPTRAAAPGDPELPEWDDPRRFLDLSPLRWEDWETQRPADPAARLRALGITPIRRDSTDQIEYDPAETGDHDPNGERVEDFHFIDFSGDGVADVIYDGPWFMRNTDGEVGAGEGGQLRLYQVVRGRAVAVFESHASLQRVWPGRPGEPVTFRTVHYGCCSDPQWGIQFFRPVLHGDTVRYDAYREVMGREGLEIPARFMDAPRRFTVSSDRYLLRAGPRIDDSADAVWPRWEGRGNALAEYGRGARGTAIAERTDSTGRVWWFVRMAAETPPRHAQITDHTESHVPTDRLGWMSSRFLAADP